MTVIAYKDGVLACDSLYSESDTHGVMLRTKICKLPSGVLYGRAGDADDRELVALLKDVQTPDDLPLASVLRELKIDCQAMMVFPDGSVWVVETGNEACAEPARNGHAIGSGGELAIGAMAVGASAESAAHIACKLHTMCREPVHTLRLE